MQIPQLKRTKDSNKPIGKGKKPGKNFVFNNPIFFWVLFVFGLSYFCCIIRIVTKLLNQLNFLMQNNTNVRLRLTLETLGGQLDLPFNVLIPTPPRIHYSFIESALFWKSINMFYFKGDTSPNNCANIMKVS